MNSIKRVPFHLRLWAGVVVLAMSVFSAHASGPNFNDTTSRAVVSQNATFTGNIGIGTSAPVGGLSVMSGNAGIGTWSPTQRLQVVGTVSATAFVGDGSGLTGISAGGWTDGGTNVYTSTTTDNVGIGTTTPASTLTIAGNIGIGTTTPYRTIAGPSNGIAAEGNVGIGTWAADNGKLIVMGGNVGIGTGSPTRLLQVGGNGGPNGTFDVQASTGSSWFSVGTGGSGVVSFNVGGGSTLVGTSVVSQGARLNVTSGSATTKAVSIYGVSGQTANIFEVNSESLLNGNYFVISSMGNIGIGTHNPLSRFAVNGGVGIGTTNTSSFLNTAAPSGGLIVENNVGIGTTAPAGGLVVMNGNAGIGTWSPTQRLQVVGTVSAIAFVGDGSGLTGISAGGWTDGGTNIYTSLTTDNVGIGTTTPASTLTVLGNIGIGTTLPYRTISGPNNGMIIEGNVGIGTWNPAYSLSVAGDAVQVGSGLLRLTSNNRVNLGISNTVSYQNSMAVGYSNDASSADTAMLVGISNAVSSGSGDSSIALGVSNTLGELGVAVGKNNTTTAQNAMAVGMSLTNSISSSVMIGPNNVSKITIRSTGLVGVGTITPASRLTVNGGVGIGTLVASSFINFAAPSGGMIVEGNVGVGTWEPLQKLQVVGTVSATAFVGDGSGLTGISAGGWSDGGTNVYTTATTDNVGIGTTTPNDGAKPHKLAVVDDVTVSSFYDDVGQIQIRGATNSAKQLTFGVDTGAAVSYGWIQSGENGVAVRDLMINPEGGNIGVGTTAPLGAFTVMSGNAGIGTWSPTQRLQVVGTVAATAFTGDGSGLTGINSGGWTDGGTNVYTSMTTDNVGIGTTTPSTTLEIVKQGTGAPLMVSSTATGDGDYLVVTSSGNVGIGTTTPVGGLAVMNGNVGIGTTSPGAKLAVEGGISTASSINVNSANSTADGIFLYDGGQLYASISDQGGGNDTGRIQLQNNGTLNVFFTASGDSYLAGGNVGIGTTTPVGALAVMNGNAGIGTWSPTQALQVVGTVSATAFVGDGSGLTGISAGGWTDGGTNVYTSATTDNVGIGTTTPASTLTIAGNIGIGTSTPYRTIAGPANGIAVEGNVGIGTWAASNGRLIVMGGNVGVGTITPLGAVTVMNGNMGIGTWIPAAKLHVAGDDFIVSGDYTGTASVPAAGAGARMFFDTQKAAFRAGSVSGTQWDNASIGNYSVALGINSTASGDQSFAWGNNATATAGDAAAIGHASDVTAFQAYSFGHHADSLGSGAISVGGVIFNDGVNSLSFSYEGGNSFQPTESMSLGHYVDAMSDYSYTLGRFLNTANNQTNNMVIGFGYDNSNRYSQAINNSIAMVMMSSAADTMPEFFLKDGMIGINTTTPVGALAVMGGNVGIGTWNPVNRLSVKGNIGIGTTLPYLTIAAPNDGLVVEGNVGIGTWNPSSKLQVVGTVAATAFSGDGSGLTNLPSASGWTDGGTNVYTATTTDNVGIGTTTPNTATLEIVKNAAQPPLKISSAANGNGDYLQIGSAGNVGIGTSTAPSIKMYVYTETANADVAFESTWGNASLTMNAYPGGGQATWSLTSHYADGSFRIRDEWNGLTPIHIESSPGHHALYLKTGGNVGIGTEDPLGGFVVMNGNAGIGTSNPSSKLQVVGTVSATAFTGDGSGLTNVANSSGWTDGGTNVYTATTTDNVGIGTTTPTSTLEVVKTAAGAAPLMVSSSATSDGNLLIITSDGNTGIGTVTPVGALAIMNGNVGIGTWSPTQRLQVVGTVAATAFSGDGSGLTGISAGGWTDGGTNVYTSTTTDTVGIGTTTASTTLEIVKQGTSAPLMISSSATGDGNYFIVTSSGNVGINTVSPSYKLNIVETGDISSLRIDASGVSNEPVMDLLSPLSTGIGSGKVFSFKVIGESYSRGLFYSDGKYGIGGGSNTRDVYISRHQSATLKISGDGDTASGNLLVLGNVGIGTTSPVGGSSIMSGNVGIGTWSPTQRLQVVGTVEATAFVGDGSGLTGISAGGWTDGGTNVYTSTTTDNVGIGTTTPASTLTVLGNIGIGTTLPYRTISGPNNGIIAEGNVGVGTWNPTQKLQVIGTVSATAFTGDGSGLTNVANSSGWTDGGTNVYTTATTDTVGIGTTTASGTLEIVRQGAAVPLMVSATAAGDGDYLMVNSAGNVGIGTTLPRGGLIVMNGNVGVGTTSPVKEVELVGNVDNDALVRLRNIHASGVAGLEMFDSSSVFAGTFGYNNPGGSNSYPGLMALITNTADIAFITGDNYSTPGTTKMIIKNASGNVGIGTTAPLGGMVVMNGNVGIGTWSPTSKLQVVGSGLISSTLKIGTGGAITNPATLNIVSAGSDTNITLRNDSVGEAGILFNNTTYGLALETFGNTPVTIRPYSGTSTYFASGGNVGIGTSTPVGGLTVMNGNVGIGTWSPTAKMIVLGGNTGIGTTAVSATLDVAAAGSLRIPYGYSPSVTEQGTVGIGTVNHQFYFNTAGTKRVVPSKYTRCLIIENLSSGDDNYPLGSFSDSAAIDGVWCTCSGTCTTKATLTLEDGSGNAMTISGTNPVCQNMGTIPDAAAVSGANATLSARESYRFDVTNTPSPDGADTYEVCVSYSVVAVP